MTQRRVLNLVLVFSMLLSMVSIVFPAAVSANTPVVTPSALTFDADPDAALTPYELNVQSPAQFINVDSTNCNVAPIVPNGTCQAIVRFTPVAPVGATKSSALRFTYEAVNTNVEGVPADVQLQGLVSPALQPVAVFDPTGFNFGNMIIGQTSAPKLFTFKNNGPLQVIVATAPTTFGNLDFPIAANPPGDCFVGLVLESGQSCETYVSFAPQAAGGVGPRNGYLSITLNGGNVITAQLSGVAVEGGLIVSTFGENFGQVIVGSASGQRQIIITNPGTNPNTVGPLAITTGGTNPTDFEVDTNTCAPNKTLLAGESCSIFVRFKPGTPGEKEALIGITAGTVTGQYIVILSGQAVEPKLTISAPGYANGELNFGAFPIGAFSDLRPVTITNSSTNAVTLDTDFPAGAGNFTVDQTACDGKTLGTNESCTLYVRFTPQAGPGEKFGTVTVDTAGLAGSYVITLHGTAVTPVLTVNTPVNGILDFGQKVINQSPSAPQSITITNNTGATLTGLTYIPNADPAFLIDNGTCGTTLTPGQSCTINVRFQPTTAGNKSGTIVIDGDNIDGSYNFFLYGIGIEPGLLITGPNLVNGQVDFGSQPIGSLSAPGDRGHQYHDRCAHGQYQWDQSAALRLVKPRSCCDFRGCGLVVSFACPMLPAGSARSARCPATRAGGGRSRSRHLSPASADPLGPPRPEVHARGATPRPQRKPHDYFQVEIETQEYPQTLARETLVLDEQNPYRHRSALCLTCCCTQSRSRRGCAVSRLCCNGSG